MSDRPRVALLDVNVLIALAWPNHAHHAAAGRWLRDHETAGWATCPVTEIGFVRISSNPRALPYACPPAEAVAILQGMRTLDTHRFWPDDVTICDPTLMDAGRLAVHSQVTDAHLLALAKRHGGCLASFDRRLAKLLDEADRSVLVTIPG